MSARRFRLTAPVEDRGMTSAGGLTGASPDGVNAVEATQAAKTETRAVAAPDESAGRVEIDRPSLRDRLVALRIELRQRLADAEVIEQRGWRCWPTARLRSPRSIGMRAPHEAADLPREGRPFRLTMPVPLEVDIHEACAGALDKLLLPPATWFEARRR